MEDLMDDDRCELCGEDADDETGMFVAPGETIWAHSSCAEDAGLELA